MKKEYKKPALEVVKIKFNTYLNNYSVTNYSVTNYDDAEGETVKDEDW